MLLDPNTPPVGRQPPALHMRPSKSYPWYGSIAGAERNSVACYGGERFTTEQQRALMSRGGDVPTAPALTVKRQATDAEIWWAIGQLPPVFAFECPIVGHMKDGRIKVIVPDGTVKIVAADGWAHRPYRKPKQPF